MREVCSINLLFPVLNERLLTKRYRKNDVLSERKC